MELLKFWRLQQQPVFVSSRLLDDSVLAQESDIFVCVWEPGDHQRKNDILVSLTVQKYQKYVKYVGFLSKLITVYTEVIKELWQLNLWAILGP